MESFVQLYVAIGADMGRGMTLEMEMKGKWRELSGDERRCLWLNGNVMVKKCIIWTHFHHLWTLSRHRFQF